MGIVLAWILDVDLVDHWVFTADALLWGVVAALPMVAFFLLSLWSDLPFFREIEDFLVDQLGKIIRQMTLWELAYIGLLAGVSEELLFRGALQNGITPTEPLVGFLAANLLFGLCHSFSKTYVVLAAFAGAYLSWVAGLEKQNLLPAIVAHSLYDFVALFAIRQLARRKMEMFEPDEPDSDLEKTEKLSPRGVPDA